MSKIEILLEKVGDSGRVRLLLEEKILYEWETTTDLLQLANMLYAYIVNTRMHTVAEQEGVSGKREVVSVEFLDEKHTTEDFAKVVSREIALNEFLDTNPAKEPIGGW